MTTIAIDLPRKRAVEAHFTKNLNLVDVARNIMEHDGVEAFDRRTREDPIVGIKTERGYSLISVSRGADDEFTFSLALPDGQSRFYASTPANALNQGGRMSLHIDRPLVIPVNGGMAKFQTVMDLVKFNGTIYESVATLEDLMKVLGNYPGREPRIMTFPRHSGTVSTPSGGTALDFDEVSIPVGMI